MTAAAIIVAAGSGQRFGHAGKSFVSISGRPMAWWSLSAAMNSSAVDELVLVCAQHSWDAAETVLSQLPARKPVRRVLGGERRQDSTLAGLQAVSPSVEIVAIHDAARPLVATALFDAVIDAARQHGAAIAAIPIADTIKRVADRRVIETIPRDDLFAVQTPQAFEKRLLLDAFARSARQGSTVTDEASLIEQCGNAVHIVPGDPSNMKVTYPADRAIAEALLRKASI